MPATTSFTQDFLPVAREICVLPYARDEKAQAHAAGFAAIDAAFHKAFTDEAALSPEARELAFIAHHRKAAMTTIRRARAQRAHRNWIAANHPKLVVLYPEQLDLLREEIARYRRLIREGRARLALARLNAMSGRAQVEVVKALPTDVLSNIMAAEVSTAREGGDAPCDPGLATGPAMLARSAK